MQEKLDQSVTPLPISDLIESSLPTDWRPLDPENSLYVG